MISLKATVFACTLSFSTTSVDFTTPSLTQIATLMQDS